MLVTFTAWIKVLSVLFAVKVSLLTMIAFGNVVIYFAFNVRPKGVKWIHVSRRSTINQSRPNRFKKNLKSNRTFTFAANIINKSKVSV